MTANEFKEVVSKLDLNSLSDEELQSISDTLHAKRAEISCIIIHRNHIRIHHPSKDKTE